MAYSFIQYQIKAEPPPGAVLASPSLTSWFAPLSEPVRLKKGLGVQFDQFYSGDTRLNPTPLTQIQGWFVPLSEPVRTKSGVRTGDQLFFSFDPVQLGSMEVPWYVPFSIPVRVKPSLKPSLQQSLAQPPRLLPPANVTVTMAATETNSDVAQFAINVYTGGGTTIPGQGAQVSIEEIPIPGNSKVSNKGN